MAFKLNKCPQLFTATIRVEDTNGKLHDLKIFHDQIIQIIGSNLTNSTEVQRSLLSAPMLCFHVKKGSNTIFTVKPMESH